LEAEIMEGIVFTPTRREVEAEDQYWADMDRVAECESWFVTQIEAESEEHECSDQCPREECRSAWDEYEEFNREYRRSTRGY
jgi:hypothetical protein